MRVTLSGEGGIIYRISGVAHRAQRTCMQLYRTGEPEHNRRCTHEPEPDCVALSGQNAEQGPWTSFLFGASGAKEHATFGPGATQGKREGQGDAHFADRLWRAPALAARARFARRHGPAHRSRHARAPVA